MGSLTYDGVVVQFEDRVLTHLQIVIVQKLRKGEPFLMSGRDADSVGDGRSSVWLHPAIPLFFKFSGSRVPSINREWLASLSASASGSQGLIVTSEEQFLASQSAAEAAEAANPRPDPDDNLMVAQAEMVTVADPTKETHTP